MRQAKLIVGFLVFAILLIAAYENIEPIKSQYVTLRLDLWFHWAQWQTRPIPLGVIVVISFLAGLVIMAARDIRKELKLRMKIRSLEKELAAQHQVVSPYASPSSTAAMHDSGEEASLS